MQPPLFYFPLRALIVFQEMENPPQLNVYIFSGIFLIKDRHSRQPFFNVMTQNVH